MMPQSKLFTSTNQDLAQGSGWKLVPWPLVLCPLSQTTLSPSEYLVLSDVFFI